MSLACYVFLAISNAHECVQYHININAHRDLILFDGCQENQTCLWKECRHNSDSSQLLIMTHWSWHWYRAFESCKLVRLLVGVIKCLGCYIIISLFCIVNSTALQHGKHQFIYIYVCIFIYFFKRIYGQCVFVCLLSSTVSVNQAFLARYFIWMYFSFGIFLVFFVLCPFDYFSHWIFKVMSIQIF